MLPLRAGGGVQGEVGGDIGVTVDALHERAAVGGDEHHLDAGVGGVHAVAHLGAGVEAHGVRHRAVRADLGPPDAASPTPTKSVGNGEVVRGARDDAAANFRASRARNARSFVRRALGRALDAGGASARAAEAAVVPNIVVDRGETVWAFPREEFKKAQPRRAGKSLLCAAVAGSWRSSTSGREKAGPGRRRVASSVLGCVRAKPRAAPRDLRAAGKISLGEKRTD